MATLMCKRCGNHFFRLETITRNGETVLIHVCADCGFQQSDVLIAQIKDRLLTKVQGAY